MNKHYPSQSLKQVLLRIPDEMREKLEVSAKYHARSLTAEVLARLESTFSSEGVGTLQSYQSPIERVETGLAKKIDVLNERLLRLEEKVSFIDAFARGNTT